MIKRDDLIHPIISGNKWRKLKGHIQYFYSSSFERIQSVGSMHSNHLSSLGYVCHELNIPFNAMIYGGSENLSNSFLQDLIKWNAEITFISRKNADEYRINPLKQENVYFIPEGGIGEAANLGIRELLIELNLNEDEKDCLIIMASGTGTGVNAILDHSKLDVLTLNPVRSMSKTNLNSSLKVLTDDRKFASYDEELMQFVLDFYLKEKILLDPIYNARLMKACFENQNVFEPYTKIIYVHTGGLLSWRTYIERYPKISLELKRIIEDFI